MSKKEAAEPQRVTLPKVVADFVRQQSSVVSPTARFDVIAREFLESRREEIYVTNSEGRYVGAILLHDIKPHLNDVEVAAHVIAEDLLREDGPRVEPAATLVDALRVFALHPGQTLPVTEAASDRLAGVLVKNDLLLALLEGQGAEKRGVAPA